MMRKTTLSILKLIPLLLVLLFTANQKTYATHAMGADITYKCLGGNQYQFTYSFFFDCSSAYNMPSTIPISYYSTACGIGPLTFNLSEDLAHSGIEVTPVCPTMQTTCTNPNATIPGVKQYIYKGTITLTQHCTDYIFAYAMNARNGSINTINTPGNDALTVFAMLNNTISPGNNSCTFTNLPVPYVCEGQTYCFNNGAVDADGDSLAYSLMVPLTGASSTPFASSVTYSSVAFNQNNPISSSPPAVFDAGNGTMCMTPSALDIGVMAMLVKEYRHGVLIGEVERDIQINVINCPNNNIPTISGINNSPTQYNDTICASTPYSFQVFSNDLDANQIVTMTWNGNIAGATFTVAGSPHPIGTFSWTPPPSAANGADNCFTVTVHDNNCPYEGSQTYAYCLKVISAIGGFSYTNLCNTVLSFTDTSTIPAGSLTAWNWNFGDPASGVNDSSTLQNPSHNFTAPGTYTVRLITTSSWGCKDTVTEQVTVTNIPYHIVHLGNDTTVCGGESLILNAGNPGATYSWSTGATTQTITTSASGSYWVRVQVGPCFSYDTINITFYPATSINIHDTNVCVGNPVSLNAGNPGFHYLWSTGATTQTITPTISGTYTVTVTDSHGCTNTNSALVSFVAYPVVNLGHDTSVCAGQSVTLNASNVGATYHWSNGATTQTIIANTSGNYSVTVTDSGICSKRDTLNLQIIPLPVVHLGNDTSICQGLPITLNAGNAGLHFSWSNGASTQTIQPNTSNTYTVTVTDNNNCIGIDAIQVTFVPYPVANLGSDTSLCAGQSITLDAANAGATYSWSTGATTQTISTNTGGNYSVTVTNSGICTDRDTIAIQIITLPVVSLGNDTTLCQGLPITLNAGNPGLFYLWSNGATTQTISPTTSNNYTVTVTDAHHCTGTDAIQITFVPYPVVNLGRDTALCAGNSITLNATNPGMIYAWSTGETTQTITVNTAGTFMVTVSNQMCNDTDTLVTTIVPLPVVHLGNDTTLCNGQPIVLDAGNTGSTFLWNTGSVNQTIFPVVSGTYRVMVTNWDQCKGYDTIHITFINYPVVNLGADRNICSNQSILLYGGSPATSYLWSDGSTSSALLVSTGGLYWVQTSNQMCVRRDSLILTTIIVPTVNIGPDIKICFGQDTSLDAHNPGLTYLWNNSATTEKIHIDVSGEYWVKVTRDGCSTIDSANVFIDPKVILNLGLDTFLCPGDMMTITPGKEYIQYTWEPGNQSGSSIIVTQPGTYTVTVKDAAGCLGSGARLVSDYCPANLYVPNAFTPIGNGMNDRFMAYGNWIVAFHMTIFNRWGEVLFDASDISQGWDGTYNGTDCPIGIYIYKIDYQLYEFAELKKYTIYGNISLIR